MEDDRQGQLFDRGEGERRREEGIARVTKKARKESPRFYADAARAIALARLDSRLFTTDDIWKAMGKIGGEMPHDGRAMATAMRDAQRDELIEPTDTWEMSDQTSCHRRPKRVWRRLP